jgi:hypothetical protein
MQLRVSTVCALAVTAALVASCAKQEAAAPTAAPAAAPAEQPSAAQATGTTTTFDNQASSQQPEAPAKPTQ